MSGTTLNAQPSCRLMSVGYTLMELGSDNHFSQERMQQSHSDGGQIL